MAQRGGRRSRIHRHTAHRVDPLLFVGMAYHFLPPFLITFGFFIISEATLLNLIQSIQYATCDSGPADVGEDGIAVDIADHRQ
jgi:hypothetical protein